MSLTDARSSKPLMCRLNLHHRWQREHNPAGEQFRRCRKCGNDDFGDPRGGTPNPKRPAMPFGWPAACSGRYRGTGSTRCFHRRNHSLALVLPCRCMESVGGSVGQDVHVGVKSRFGR